MKWFWGISFSDWDFWIDFQETQYSRWLAACRMAAKGKTMADSGFDSEVKAIQAFLSMQHPASQPVINPATLDIKVDDYVAARFLRKTKNKVSRIRVKLWMNFSDKNWQFSVETENPWGPHKRQRFEFAGSQNEFHQSLAIFAWFWSVFVCR